MNGLTRMIGRRGVIDPKYRALVDTVAPQYEGNVSQSDDIYRVVSGFEADKRMQIWADANELKLSSGVPCVNRLLGKPCRSHNGPHLECPDIPGADHTSLWLKDGKPAVIATQPYALTWEILQELMVFCQEYGLRSDISAWGSWHFPGRTVLVCLMPQEPKP